LLTLAVAGFGSPLPAAVAQNANQPWVTAWATSQHALGDTKVTNATVRMVARVTIAGESVKIRLDNTFGLAPVVFRKASIGPRVRGPALATGLVKSLTFGGKNSVTLPAGATVESDPVALHVHAQQDVAVSLFVADSNVQPSQHSNAVVTSYLTESGAGDQTASEDGRSFTAKTTSLYWLKSIDVRPVSPASAIVAFGDSITDGACTTLDAHDRWEDILAQRLALQETVQRAVINEGISGNTVIVAGGASSPGVERLNQDVLSHSKVTHAILFMGTNDIQSGASANQVIGGMKNIISRVKAHGIKIIGVTIIPRHGWRATMTVIRNRVNDWIRNRADFDSVIDFDKVVRSTGDPNLLDSVYNCDGIHPSPFGYFQMGKSVDLSLFNAK
jgi:lysophospholipase L1-like esterase